MARFRTKYRKDSNGRKVLHGFYAEFYDPGRQPSQKRVPLRTRDQVTAIQKFAEIERKYARGDFDPWHDQLADPGMRFDRAKDAFLASRAGRSQKTLDMYEMVLTLLEKTLPPGMTVRMIEQRHVTAFLSSARERKDGTAYTLSATSRRTYVRHLRAFFRWCLTSKIIDRDPTPVAELNKGKARRTVPVFLSEKDVNSLVTTITSDAITNGNIRFGNDWLADVIRFAVGTGLRRGELCNLRWSAVDLEHGYINVRNIADDDEAADFTTKSGEERSVPLAGEALRIVERLHASRVSEADGYVFTGAQGDQLNDQHLSKRFRHYKRKAGLRSEVHFHTLRHTFASWWVMRGGDLYRLKEVMGHSDIKTTLIYAHLRPEALKEEMEKVMGSPAVTDEAPSEIEVLRLQNAALRAELERSRAVLA